MLELDGNLSPKAYIGWVQSTKRIFKLKEYNAKKSFRSVILKLKGHVSLWYENLKKTKPREAKSKIKTSSKLKKHIKGRFLPSS